MDSKFDRLAICCYFNFMKFTIANSIYNLILIILENSSVIFIIDLMFDDKILGETFSPFYILSPHFYIDMINEQFPNECNSIFFSNNSNTNDTTGGNLIQKEDMYLEFNNNTKTFDIIFFGKTLYSVSNSFCIYSSYLIFIVIGILCMMTIFFVLLFFIKSRGKINIAIKCLLHILTNGVLLFIRPFFVIIPIVLINRPIVYLYKSNFILPDLVGQEIVYLVISLLFLVYGVGFAYVVIKYINNSFYFESFPYDYFSSGEGLVLLIIKVIIGLKISYDKLLGLNQMFAMNLIIGVLMFVRCYTLVADREYIVNHVYLKNTSALLSFFYCFYIVLKLLNTYFDHLKDYSAINHTMELILIIIVLITFIIILFKSQTQFTFRDKKNFIVESMKFMYYVSRTFSPQNSLKQRKVKREVFIDNVIIGHKMKCRMEDCIICCEDIYNPDLKTLCLILYQQFLQNEKEYKEENEGVTLILKLMYIKMIDEKKIHRIAYTILKNMKNKNLSFATLLKINYMYQKNLDELNQDLQGLITIKYGEFNDELLNCIKNFEDIIGFIKSKTEKVELVTNKTNLIGQKYEQLVKDLQYLKKNKRIYFDQVNFLQILCIVRLVFPRQLGNELTESLDYNFVDFLEIVDHVFIDNISFLVRYDFNNRAWRIKKIPKIFIDMTKYKISELLDQSFETIFPKVLSKNLVKRLEEKIILSNMNDSKLEFKTVICDSETNARYVKFVVDIIPHLENSYMMFMQCHFHRRQLLIIDEFGNFVNGSQVLYEKVGINADIVAASKGRINMFTMFNLDKKQKLDDVTIVSIASEGVVDATKKLFLLEAEQGKGKQTYTPNFLDSFLKNEANGGLKKEKIVVFLHLFSTELINDVKYYIYNIKISNPDDKKNKKDQNTNSEVKNGGARHTVTIKRINTDYSNSSEEKELLPKETIKKEKKPEKEKNDNNSSLNNFNYYYAFLDSQHSMSMTMNYKTNLDSYNSSQANSSNSDVFSYLYMKTIGSKSHSNKFETFIFIIISLNIVLILYGLISISYIAAKSADTFDLIDIIEEFFTMNSRIFKSTNVFFCFLTYDKTVTTVYNKFVEETMNLTIEYDEMIKIILNYDLSKALSNISAFNSDAFKYFGQQEYNSKFNYDSLFIHLDSAGNYTIKNEQIKYIIDLFALTLNQLSNIRDLKLYLNTSYLEYEYIDKDDLNNYMKIVGIDKNELQPSDKYYFTGLVNLYQHFFNYFSSFVSNFEDMKDYLTEIAFIHFNKAYLICRSLLIVILIINIIFVLICLSSILIFQKILKNEFKALYGLSEDSITRLKEKFQYVKELIKWEQTPSLIYNKIRKMREEIDQAQLEERIKQKKKEKEAYTHKTSLVEKDRKEDRRNNDAISVITTGSTGPSSDYLQFSGAVKGLFRSNTLRAKERLQKISKESRKMKASQDLLNRLNFDFEMTQQFIFFIVFMTAFYVLLGIVVIMINDNNYYNMKVSLEFTTKFNEKFFYLFNFYSGVKLSIMLNQNAPYVIFNGTYSPDCKECIYSYLNNYSVVSGELSNMNSKNKIFLSINTINKNLQGNDICSVLYTEYKSDIINYIQTNGPSELLPQLIEVCKASPIFQSNVDSILNEIIVSARIIYSLYLFSPKDITTRLNYLQKNFLEPDILITMFSHFYYEYIYQSTISNFNKTITNSFYNFLIIVFVINIFLDCFMILFIWFKIYRQIITSVNNVQLVTDSVSIV